MSADTVQCAVCDKPAAYKCPLCFGPSYCGELHQTVNWTQHESTCNVIHAESQATGVLLPYDVAEGDSGAPTVVTTMMRVVDTDGSQHINMIESRIGHLTAPDGNAVAIGANQQKTPVMRSARTKRTTGTRESRIFRGTRRGFKTRLDSAGIGREPNPDEEKLSLHIELFRRESDYLDKRSRVEDWNLTVDVAKNAIWNGSRFGMEKVLDARDKEQKTGW